MLPYFFFFDGFGGQAPGPAVVSDTHDGFDEHRKKRWQREKEEREALRAELRAKYEGIRAEPTQDIEGDVATTVARYAPVKAPDLPPVAQIDWDRLLGDLAAIQAILLAAERAAILKAEREDEEGAAIALLI